MSLIPAQLERYARHLTLPEIGPAGQERLADASVLLVGAGGLGSPAAIYLAAAGVGRIGIVEFDVVDRSNLHRQVLFGDGDVGQHKLDAAVRRLRDLNPHIDVVPHAVRLSAGNAREIVRGYDAVLDGSDTFAVKYLVNDAAVLEGVPDVYASVLRFQGEISVFGVPDGPCYRCLYPAPPAPGDVPSCAEAGVLGAVPGVLGTLQAVEVIKLVLRTGEPLAGRLLRYDALSGRFREFSIDRDPACAVCGDSPSQTEMLADYDDFCSTIPTGAPTRSMPVTEITVSDLKARLDRGEAPFILDVRQPVERDIASIGGELIPMNELPDRLDELDEHRDDQLVVVYCRTGSRSARVVEWLRQQGFGNAVNLRGGIHAWSDEVDSSVTKY